MVSLKRIAVLFLLFIPLGVMAQQGRIIHKEYTLSDYAPMSISYYGNLATHPGLKLGFDWNLFLIEKTKARKKRTKTIRKMLLISPGIAAYSHKASHKGVLVSTDLAWRRYGKRLFFREVGLGIAYFGKFNSGETWEKNTNGNVVEIGNTARGYLAPSVSFAFGKHFNIQQTFPGAVFLRVNANVLSDYNASLLPELSMEVGFRTSLGWGIHRGDVKTIIKRK